MRGNLGNCQSQLIIHPKLLSVFVAEVEFMIVDASLDDLDVDLFGGDDMGCNKLVIERNLQLGLERD